jgi:hypothetical protein
VAHARGRPIAGERSHCYARAVLGALRRVVLACVVPAIACAGDDDATATEAGTTESQTDDGPTTSDDGDDTNVETGDATTGATTATTSTGEADTTGDACSLPDPAPPWLEDDLRDTVARLSGELELEPGTTLTDRASTQRRARAAAWFMLRFAELGLAGESHDYGTGTNVLARLPATTASEGTLVFGAHYDTVPASPGADDNASGSAVVLALARHLQDVPCRRYDVVLALFDEEEIGLVGSTAYAAKLVQDEEPIVAVHTADQLGWDGDGDRRVEVERPDDGLFELYQAAAAELASPIELVQTNTGFTDHEAFRAAGFPAVGLSEEFASGDTTPHYHLPSDTYDTVDFGYLVANATLVNHVFARVLAEP